MAKQSKLPELKKQIKDNALINLYLMYGEEAFAKQTYINKLISMTDDGNFSDFNKITLDGKKVSFAEIDDAIESYPMMSDKKLILIKDSGIFYKADEEQKEYWSKLLESIPEYIILIFDESSVDKRSTLFKKVVKFGLEVEFEYLNETELVTWVEREVLKSKMKISKDLAQYLVSICDPGISNLKNELDKLLNYCDTQILKSDIERVVSKAVSVKVFELTDNIMVRNSDGALKILNDLKTIKEPAFKILYLLLSTFDKMLRSSLMLSEGASYNDIAVKIGVAPFIAKKYTNSARNFGENYLVDRITAVADLDLAIKNGETGDWEGLERYVIDACERVS